MVVSNRIAALRVMVRSASSDVGDIGVMGADHHPLLSDDLTRVLWELVRWRHDLDDDAAFARGMEQQFGVTPDATRRLLANWARHQSLLKTLATCLATVPCEQVDTHHLFAALEGWMASEACREAIVRRRADADPYRRARHPEDARFLVGFDLRGTFVQVRADTVARVLGYVQSGHAARDLGAAPDDDPHVSALRDVMADLRAGRDVAPARVDKVFCDRLEDVCRRWLVAAVCAAAPDAGESAAPVDAWFALQLPEPAGFLPAGDRWREAGTIPVAVRDAHDENHWHVLAATCHEDVPDSTAQLQIFSQALRNSMVVGMAPFGTGQTFSFALVRPALTSPDVVDDWLLGGRPLTRAEARAINSLLLYRQAMNSEPASSSDPVDVYRMALFPCGADHVAAPACDEEADTVVRKAVERMVAAADFFADPDVSLTYRPGYVSDETPRSIWVSILALMASIDGVMVKVAGGVPEDGARRLIPPLEAIRAKLHRDFYRLKVETQRRLRDLKFPPNDDDSYEPPPGLPHWSSAQAAMFRAACEAYRDGLVAAASRSEDGAARDG